MGRLRLTKLRGVHEGPERALVPLGLVLGLRCSDAWQQRLWEWGPEREELRGLKLR